MPARRHARSAVSTAIIRKSLPLFFICSRWAVKLGPPARTTAAVSGKAFLKQPIFAAVQSISRFFTVFFNHSVPKRSSVLTLMLFFILFRSSSVKKVPYHGLYVSAETGALNSILLFHPVEARNEADSSGCVPIRRLKRRCRKKESSGRAAKQHRKISRSASMMTASAAGNRSIYCDAR